MSLIATYKPVKSKQLHEEGHRFAARLYAVEDHTFANHFFINFFLIIGWSWLHKSGQKLWPIPIDDRNNGNSDV